MVKSYMTAHADRPGHIHAHGRDKRETDTAPPATRPGETERGKNDTERGRGTDRQTDRQTDRERHTYMSASGNKGLCCY